MLIDAVAVATIANNVDQRWVSAVTLRAIERQFSNDNFNNGSHTHNLALLRARTM